MFCVGGGTTGWLLVHVVTFLIFWFLLVYPLPIPCGFVQVRVANHDFIGCGEARNKTTAQAIAAESFVNFLKEKGLVPPDEVPSMPSSSSGSAPPSLMGGGSSHHEGAWSIGGHQGGAQFMGHQGRAGPVESMGFQRGAGPSAPPPSLVPPSHFTIKAQPPPKPGKVDWWLNGMEDLHMMT